MIKEDAVCSLTATDKNIDGVAKRNIEAALTTKKSSSWIIWFSSLPLGIANLKKLKYSNDNPNHS
jgi:hypothetical protein